MRAIICKCDYLINPASFSSLIVQDDEDHSQAACIGASLRKPQHLDEVAILEGMLGKVLSVGLEQLMSIREVNMLY